MARTVLLIWLLLSGTVALGQSYGDSKYKQKFNKADAHIFNGAYLQALPLVQELHQTDSAIANLNYMLGVCHLNGTKDYLKAIHYLEIASKDVSKDFRETDWREKKAPGITYLYLGRAYHYLNQFDRAVSNYYNYRSFIDVADIETYNKVRMVIKHAENAMELVAVPVKVEMVNLGSGVNSPYPDYAPVISADGQSLIFTSRRPGGSRDAKDKDGMYFEDIYVSSRQPSGSWGRPQLLGGGITSSGHQAAIGLSPDGQTLFVYRDDNGLGEIYQSDLKDNVWTVPVKLGSDINTSAWETHATLSPDGEMLIFTSNRSGGYGGRDIWYSKRLPDGNWGLAQNIGSVINTQYDEESPFLAYDGKTLFFSSQGHTSMGGFDIFRSELKDGVWQEATNLGYPINTSEDDIFFVLSADGRTAYLSSRREGGLGETDIYSLELEVTQAEDMAVASGLVRMPSGVQDGPQAVIVVRDGAGKEVGTYRSNRYSGKYVLLLVPNRSYTAEYRCTGFEAVTRTIQVGPDMSYEMLGRSFDLGPVTFGEVASDERQVSPSSEVVEAPQPLDEDVKAKEEQARLMAEAEAEAARLDSILALTFAQQDEIHRLEDEAEARREAEERRLQEEAHAEELRKSREAAARQAALEIERKKEDEVKAKAEQIRIAREAAAQQAALEASDKEEAAQQSVSVSEEVPSVGADSDETAMEVSAEQRPSQLDAAQESTVPAQSAVSGNAESSQPPSSPMTEEEMKRAALLKRLEELKKKKQQFEQGIEPEKAASETAPDRAEKEAMERAAQEQQRERILAEAKAKQEAEAAAQAEADRVAAEEERAASEREQQELALRMAAQESEALAKAEEERIKAEAELRIREEMEAAEAKAKLEAETAAEEQRMIQESALAQARERERAEQERLKSEADRSANEMEAKAIAEAREKEEAEVKAREEEAARARAEQERIAREEQQRQLAEAKAREEEAARVKAEQERIAREEQQRQLAEAKAREEEAARAKAEQERIAREEQQRQLAEAKAREEEAARARAEQERIAREEQQRQLAEAKAREQAIARAKADEELVRAEKARQEAERKAREAAARERAVQQAKQQEDQRARPTTVKPGAALSEKEIRETIEMNRRLMSENQELRNQLRMVNAKLDLILAELQRQNEQLDVPAESYNEEVVTALNEGKKLILQNILFDYNKARLRGSSERELDKLADFLKEHSDIKLTVAGHTDAIGDPSYNLRLSRARAEAVVSYLVSKGVSGSRLKSVGYGQTRPIARNIHPDGQDNPLGRQMNRRIEISVTAGDADLIEVREEVISEELRNEP